MNKSLIHECKSEFMKALKKQYKGVEHFQFREYVEEAIDELIKMKVSKMEYKKYGKPSKAIENMFYFDIKYKADLSQVLAQIREFKTKYDTIINEYYDIYEGREYYFLCWVSGTEKLLFEYGYSITDAEEKLKKRVWYPNAFKILKRGEL